MFIHLMIVVMYIMSARLYDNSKSVYNSKGVHTSKKITFENLVESVNRRQRIRGAEDDLTMITDGYSSSKKTFFIN
jgi:hypothetical protein